MGRVSGREARIRPERAGSAAPFRASHLQIQRLDWHNWTPNHPSRSSCAGLTRGVKRLVYFEEHATAPLAIQREKNIKHWPREWKIDLIVSMNPDWRDLYDEVAA